MQHLTKKIIAALTWTEAAIAIAAYALVAGLLLMDVVGRELFNISIYGSQKVAVQATLIASFLGMSIATSQGVHLRAEAMDALVPRRWSALADRFGHAISFALFGALAIVSFQFMMDTRNYGIRMAVLGWPMWPVQLVLPVAFGSSALKSLAFAVFPALVAHRKIEMNGA